LYLALPQAESDRFADDGRESEMVSSVAQHVRCEHSFDLFGPFSEDVRDLPQGRGIPGRYFRRIFSPGLQEFFIHLELDPLETASIPHESGQVSLERSNGCNEPFRMRECACVLRRNESRPACADECAHVSEYLDEALFAGHVRERAHSLRESAGDLASSEASASEDDRGHGEDEGVFAEHAHRAQQDRRVEEFASYGFETRRSFGVERFLSPVAHVGEIGDLAIHRGFLILRKYLCAAAGARSKDRPRDRPIQ
jgi:hypothetical protein